MAQDGWGTLGKKWTLPHPGSTVAVVKKFGSFNYLSSAQNSPNHLTNLNIMKNIPPFWIKACTDIKIFLLKQNHIRQRTISNEGIVNKKAI